MEELRNEVVKYMRSCLNSNKDAVCSLFSLRQLNDEYKLVIGENIPYQKLGYRTLEDLIKSVPHEFYLTKKGNGYFVKATESAKSAHITDMVSKQKAAKKRPPRVRFYHNPPPRLQQTSKWRPKSNIPNRYYASKRPQELNHSQFINRSPTVIHKAPPVASKVVVPEHSTYNKPQQPATAAPVPVKGIQKRLTSQRIKENMEALNGNDSLKGNASSVKLNNTSHVSNKPNSVSKVAPQKPVQEQNVVSGNLNPLASTRQRLIKKMSELDLERDSGNSSPTSDILPSPLFSKTPEFVKTGDVLVDLKTFAEMHGLGEITVDITTINAKRKKFYTCKIKVGSHVFISYPEDFLKPAEAQHFCCEKALKELIPKYKRKSLMIASERDILERIPPMLEKHPHGIWAWQLKLDYSDKYNEVLSDDWLQTIDVSPCVQIENVSNDYILYHCRPGDKGNRRMAMPVSNVSVPANTVQFGEDGKLTAYVTCVLSANEIWCRQIGNPESEIFSNMMERLQIYYQEHEHELIPRDILAAGYYIAKHDNEYFRVRAVIISELDINCFFIDCGDEVAIPRKDIFELKREYATAQAQAFVCRLYGLEMLYEVSSNSQSLTSLYEHPVVVELALDVTNNENTNDALPVFMYNCESGESINEYLIPQLTMELASPYLKKDDITEVYVSNIEPNGDIYVQVRSQGYENWLQLKQQLEEEINIKPPRDTLHRVTRSNSEDKLYFIKQNADGSWHRIKLIDWAPQGDHAQIYFVDDGHADVIRVADEDLYPLEAINDILNNYPHQAVRVKMSLEKIPSNFVSLATKVMPTTHPVMLKIVGTSEKDIPLVKLFRRNPGGELFCINTSIVLESELSLRKEENNNIRGKFRLVNSDCVPSTGTLKCPTLPEVGEEVYFEVYVPIAVSPYNFFVQPLESQQKLNDMMESLQERYKHVQYGNLKVDDVMPGSIYASKHDDGFWYRTSVIKVIHSGSVSVFYCDFGYYQTLPVKHLLPLDDEFMELPYQALKAKLAGIKPIKSKWTMEDCEKFKQLIEKKRLHSLLVAIEKDILYESDLVLKIYLCDTSSVDDIFIREELVRQGIAVIE